MDDFACAGASEQSWKSGHFNLFLEEKLILTNVSEIGSCEQSLEWSEAAPGHHPGELQMQI